MSDRSPKLNAEMALDLLGISLTEPLLVVESEVGDTMFVASLVRERLFVEV
jgi:hypothetical protein